MYPQINKIGILKVLIDRRSLFSLARSEIRGRLYSNQIFYGFYRDSKIPFKAPKARIPITIRPLRNSDIPELLDLQDQRLGPEELKERIMRLRVIKTGIQTCYVAVTSNDVPCYMQWLIGPQENKRVLKLSMGVGYPLLADDEMLGEFIFTPEKYRGQGIMPCALSKIADIGFALGARRIVGFFHTSSIPSLRAWKRLGCVPFTVRKDKYRLFRRQMVFEPLPAGVPHLFDQMGKQQHST